MRETSLIEAFNFTDGEFAFIATYDFEPMYFEKRILPTNGLRSARRIVVLMDHKRYLERLKNSEFMAAGFNRRYLVLPISRSSTQGVFHPKLYLVLGAKRSIAIVGSNNCTNAGTAYNMELCSTFSISDKDADTDDSRVCRRAIIDIYKSFRSFTRNIEHFSKTLEESIFNPIEAQHEWIRDEISSAFTLLHSHEKPIWPEVEAALKGQDIKKIYILSPFFDRRLDFLKMVKSTWPGTPIIIVVQQGYSNLPTEEITEFFNAAPANHQLLEARPRSLGRQLHAKAIAFETERVTFWLTGSANATTAAMNGSNTEACLWFRTEEKADYILKNADFEIESIEPASFIGGQHVSPEDGPSEKRPILYLESARLTQDGELNLDFSVPADANSLVLGIRNFNERDPSLLLKVSHLSMRLEQEQIAQIRGTAFCQLSAVIAGQALVGNCVALVQFNHLLREPTSDGGKGGNLNKIQKSGNGLVPFLDTFPSPVEAIKFLHGCNIGFFDGTAGGTLGRGGWNPRNPFKTDTPSGWLASLTDEEAADLKKAIWSFVERHQKEKLEKHIRRGNINGLENFMDIFRTLNTLLLTYNARRSMSSDQIPIIPHPYVIDGIQKNMALLIGEKSGEVRAHGFIQSILKNLDGNVGSLTNRLTVENIPAMVMAAIEAVIEVRIRGLKLQEEDAWSRKQRAHVLDWITQNGLILPTAEAILLAKQEYTPVA